MRTVIETFIALILILFGSIQFQRADLQPQFWVFPFLLGLAILRSFCLLHDLGHRSLFRSKWLNDFMGIVASLLCAVPYYPWRKIHTDHHAWVGYKEKDPTESEVEFEDLSKYEQIFANFAWKFSLPLLSYSFSLRTFWHFSSLVRRYPRDKVSIIFSILIIPVVHGCLMISFGKEYLIHYGLGFLMFLFFMDPLVIAQHAGVPVYKSGNKNAKPTPAHQQESFARTLVFPNWVTRHILLGFNLHSAHHARPTVPGVDLLNWNEFKPTHIENGFSWIMRSKRQPLSDLLKSRYL